MDCVTPSHPDAIPPGESVDITKLLENTESILDPETEPKEKIDYKRWDYHPRVPVMEQLQKNTNLPFLKAQSATDKELADIIQEVRNKKSDVSPTPHIQKRKLLGTFTSPPSPPIPPLDSLLSWRPLRISIETSPNRGTPNKETSPKKQTLVN